MRKRELQMDIEAIITVIGAVIAFLLTVGIVMALWEKNRRKWGRIEAGGMLQREKESPPKPFASPRPFVNLNDYHEKRQEREQEEEAARPPSPRETGIVWAANDEERMDMRVLEMNALRALPDEETMPLTHTTVVYTAPWLMVSKFAVSQMDFVIDALVSDALGNRQVRRRYTQLYNSGGFHLDPQLVEELG